jgi:hypothetical protein
MNTLDLLLKLTSERKEEARRLLNVFLAEADDWKTFSWIRKRLEWHPQRLARWLKRLVQDKVLLKKSEGKHTYYRLNPGKLAPYMGLLTIMQLERLIKELDSKTKSVFTLGETSCPELGGFPLKGWYMHFYPNPFWEYDVCLDIFGFPEEDDLLPIERVILHHIIDRLIEYFRRLAWLRAKILGRKLLKVQISLAEDLRFMLMDFAMKEWIATGKREFLERAKRICQLGPAKLVQEARQITARRDIDIPESNFTNECPNLWSVMLKLREMGYANNLALIVKSGPQRTVLTARGLSFHTDEDGVPLPPLKLPRGLSYEKLQGDLLVRISSQPFPPSVRLFNPLPFPIKPCITLHGNEYILKLVTDKNTLRRLEKGDIPSRKMTVLDIEELMQDSREN